MNELFEAMLKIITTQVNTPKVYSFQLALADELRIAGFPEAADDMKAMSPKDSYEFATLIGKYMHRGGKEAIDIVAGDWVVVGCEPQPREVARVVHSSSYRTAIWLVDGTYHSFNSEYKIKVKA